ncbi:MAG: hypothetical protein M0P70_09630 [Desulfobulbaceae bacterium]|nr:hypothetical protein [Desulfobulbaceae bacterium]
MMECEIPISCAPAAKATFCPGKFFFIIKMMGVLEFARLRCCEKSLYPLGEDHEIEPAYQGNGYTSGIDVFVHSLSGGWGFVGGKPFVAGHGC